MARIPLRTYNREVENLIERGQIEEAIAHCKNILKQFPKHIETYRLLGKSFLESQRYAEAADILQRVLSVFPDDFVSQLGMSIIREDEGNLDAAIWHMERAYEVQPFNRPVQDELRRLYGRRDGAEPPRIRLTRGALVRMYARGDLYPQAIAEIRAAQAEDPSRIDLIVLLARMYYLSGQKIEATEISSSLITKLPYCYEANRILMEVLPETSRADDARIFQQRLFSLDPYAAFISPNAPTSAQVPEQTVMVERVDWQPSMTDAQAPDWAKTIGVEWEETSDENLPDWLTTIQPGQGEAVESVAPELMEEQPAAPVQSSDELIPEFLKDAGWEPSDGTVEEQPLSVEEIETTEDEGEIVEAEIPDWLQSFAPDETAVSEVEEEKDEEDQMGWLEGILPAGAAVVADELTQPDENQTGDVAAATLPDELKGELEEETEPADWIQELSTDTSEPTPETGLPAEETSEVPDWLTDLSATPEETSISEEISAVETPEAVPTEIPDWTQQEETGEPASEIVAETQEEIAETVAEEQTVPDWLTELTATPQETSAVEEISAVEMPSTAADEIPEWIKQVETEEPAGEMAVDSLEATGEEETVPDWLAELKQEAPAETAAVSEIETVTTAQDLVEIPSQESEAWVPEEQQADEQSAPEAAESAPGSMDMDAAMAWMEALAARQGAEAESLMISQPEERSETPPEWLQQESEQAEEALPEIVAEVSEPGEEVAAPVDEFVQPAKLIQAETPAETEPMISTIEGAPTTEMPEGDLDSALAWMEALAARQGADEESLKISEPEERSETPPEWIAQLEEKATETIPETSAEAEEVTQTLEATLRPDEAFSETSVGEEEIPAEVMAIEETPTLEAIEPSPQEPVLEEIDVISPVADELSVVTSILEEETTLEVPSTELTPPTNEQETMAEEVSTAEMASEVLPPQAAEETETPEAEIPDWLRSYEEEQRAQEPVWKPDETFTPEAVAEEELPDWLIEETPEAPVVESTPAQTDLAEQGTAELPAAEETTDMPGWLKALQESQPVQEIAEAPAEPESTWTQEYTPEPAASPIDGPHAAPPASDALALAQATLRSGDIESAAEQYTQMINSGQHLDVVIQDLKNALDHFPVDISLWQALGDAYIRSNHVQEALDAYTKAEELLR